MSNNVEMPPSSGRSRRGLGCLTVSVIVVVGVYFWWTQILFPTYEFNYKLTLEVETPEGLKTGSSVIRVWKRDDANALLPGPASGVKTEQYGEVPFIEIRPGTYLFALALHVRSVRLASDAFREETGGRQTRFDVSIKRLIRLRKAKELPPELYPLLVTFEDINDPASVRRVDPNDLAARLGQGVKLKRMIIEITDEQVEFGRIEPLFPWWSDWEVQIGDKFRRASSPLYDVGRWSFSRRQR